MDNFRIVRQERLLNWFREYVRMCLISEQLPTYTYEKVCLPGFFRQGKRDLL